MNKHSFDIAGTVAILLYGIYFVIYRMAVGKNMYRYQRWQWHKLFNVPEHKIPNAKTFSFFSGIAGGFVVVWAILRLVKLLGA